MQKISYIGLLFAIITVTGASAADRNTTFRAEVLDGLDLVSVRKNINEPDVAPGEMGAEVYQTAGVVNNSDIKMFIPTSMYVRAGGGLNLGFATSNAKKDNAEYESSGSWTTQIGLGWNLSSYVRTELDFQNAVFKFSDLDNYSASFNTIGAMLYFDFARRYIQTGDVTRRRTFVPFMGLGAGLGQYEFEGASGCDGAAIAAPRAALGFNVMLNDLVGIDVMYQYQMMIGDGFGWAVNNSTYNVSNLMLSMRANF